MRTERWIPPWPVRARIQRCGGILYRYKDSKKLFNWISYPFETEKNWPWIQSPARADTKLRSRFHSDYLSPIITIRYSIYGHSSTKERLTIVIVYRELNKAFAVLSSRNTLPALRLNQTLYQTRTFLSTCIQVIYTGVFDYYLNVVTVVAFRWVGHTSVLRCATRLRVRHTTRSTKIWIHTAHPNTNLRYKYT